MGNFNAAETVPEALPTRDQLPAPAIQANRPVNALPTPEQLLAINQANQRLPNWREGHTEPGASSTRPMDSTYHPKGETRPPRAQPSNGNVALNAWLSRSGNRPVNQANQRLGSSRTRQNRPGGCTKPGAL